MVKIERTFHTTRAYKIGSVVVVHLTLPFQMKSVLSSPTVAKSTLSKRGVISPRL